MTISLISFTLNGSRLNQALSIGMKKSGYCVCSYAVEMYAQKLGLIPLTESLNQWTAKQFTQVGAIIFIGAAGIAVRAIAPFLNHKTTDPAVIVLDERGEFVIPILSGHIGGANELVGVIANILGSTPVITTATDINHKFAVDVFAKRNELHISNMIYAKEISAAILNNLQVGVSSDFPIEGALPDNLDPNLDHHYGICISFDGDKKPFLKTLNLIPQVLTLGIGCRKGKSMDEIERAVLNVLETRFISIKAVKNVATIDLKKNERGLLEFCEKYNLEIQDYSAEILEKVQGDFVESDYVKSITGIGNVCERAAILGSKKGTLIQKKIAGSGVTVALAMKDWSMKFE